MQKEFVSDIENYFDLADFVVSRGGANALFELFALKKPSLIIPLSKNESRGDQIENAEYFKNKNMCKVLNEENLSNQTLMSSLKELEKNKKQIVSNISKGFKNDANETIIKLILERTQN